MKTLVKRDSTIIQYYVHDDHICGQNLISKSKIKVFPWGICATFDTS